MTEIDISEKIDASIVIAKDVEYVERYVNERIRDALSNQIMEALDDMAFVDMKLNHEKNVFEIEASLVLCAKNDLATNMQMQAQRMKEYGFTDEQVEEILNMGIENTGGF